VKGEFSQNVKRDFVHTAPSSLSFGSSISSKLRDALESNFEISSSWLSFCIAANIYFALSKPFPFSHKNRPQRCLDSHSTIKAARLKPPDLVS
jgi:hypothetical protein